MVNTRTIGTIGFSSPDFITSSAIFYTSDGTLDPDLFPGMEPYQMSFSFGPGTYMNNEGPDVQMELVDIKSYIHVSNSYSVAQGYLDCDQRVQPSELFRGQGIPAVDAIHTGYWNGFVKFEASLLSITECSDAPEPATIDMIGFASLPILVWARKRKRRIQRLKRGISNRRLSGRQSRDGDWLLPPYDLVTDLCKLRNANARTPIALADVLSRVAAVAVA
jgi:hypothetical protein